MRTSSILPSSMLVAMAASAPLVHQLSSLSVSALPSLSIPSLSVPTLPSLSTPHVSIPTVTPTLPVEIPIKRQIGVPTPSVSEILDITKSLSLPISTPTLPTPLLNLPRQALESPEVPTGLPKIPAHIPVGLISDLPKRQVAIPTPSVSDILDITKSLSLAVATPTPSTDIEDLADIFSGSPFKREAIEDTVVPTDLNKIITEVKGKVDSAIEDQKFRVKRDGLGDVPDVNELKEFFDELLDTRDDHSDLPSSVDEKKAELENLSNVGGKVESVTNIVKIPAGKRNTVEDLKAIGLTSDEIAEFLQATGGSPSKRDHLVDPSLSTPSVSSLDVAEEEKIRIRSLIQKAKDALSEIQTSEVKRDVLSVGVDEFLGSVDAIVIQLVALSF